MRRVWRGVGVGLRTNATLTSRDHCTLKIPHLLHSKAQKAVFMHNTHLHRRITSNRNIQLEREFPAAPIPYTGLLRLLLPRVREMRYKTS